MDKKKIAGNWIVRNLFWAIVFVLGIVVLVSILLSLVTQHGKEITVPDFTNLSYNEARKVASSAGVKVVVIDSTYIRRIKPGVVYMQTPKAGESVKRGRKIRLSTNTMVAKKIAMPSLVGYSLRQAKAELTRSGLVLGRIIYVRDIATNTVLRQQYRGADIAAGTGITSGSTINLVLGLNEGEDMTFVPDVKGKQYLRAVDQVQENYLNVAKAVFDPGIANYADSVNAVVYSQKPATAGDKVRMGSEVTLYLTLDQDKVK